MDNPLRSQTKVTVIMQTFTLKFDHQAIFQTVSVRGTLPTEKMISLYLTYFRKKISKFNFLCDTPCSITVRDIKKY